MAFSSPGLVNRCVHLQVLSVTVNCDKATDCVQQHPASFTDQMNNEFFLPWTLRYKVIRPLFMNLQFCKFNVYNYVQFDIYLTTVYHEVKLYNDN